MTYEEKKKIADDYLSNIAGGLGWDDLADINSLHSCDDKEEIIAACQERLMEDGFPDDLLEHDNESF